MLQSRGKRWAQEASQCGTPVVAQEPCSTAGHFVCSPGFHQCKNLRNQQYINIYMYKNIEMRISPFKPSTVVHCYASSVEKGALNAAGMDRVCILPTQSQQELTVRSDGLTVVFSCYVSTPAGCRSRSVTYSQFLQSVLM